MNRDLILIALSLLTWGIGEGMFFYFQPVYLKELGANPIEIGVILGAVGLVMTLSHIPAGIMSDKIGRKPLLLTSWSIGLVSAWIMALAQTLPTFIAGLLLYSVSAFVMSPLNSYITTARGKLRIERALTITLSAYSIGAILGPFLGGMIGGRTGLHTIYRVSACIFIISTFIILFIRPQTIDSPPAKDENRGWQIDNRFYKYLVLIFIVMFATYLPQPLTPNYLQEYRGVTVAQLGQLGSAAGIGIVVLNLALGSIPVHIGLIIAQGCVGLFSLLLWQGKDLPWYFIGYFLMGGYRATRVLAVAQVRSLIHQSKMGFAYGIIETAAAAAVIIAPPIAGYLYTKHSSLIYSASILLIVFALMLSLLYNKFHSTTPSTTAEIQP